MGSEWGCWEVSTAAEPSLNDLFLSYLYTFELWIGSNFIFLFIADSIASRFFSGLDSDT